MTETNGIWVFGYGSLCWNPGFEFERSTVGFIKGFGRRFWQGNTTHRGTLEKPGRVVTLIESDKEITYGRVFKIKDISALPYLEQRECNLGGYLTAITTFYSRDGKSAFPALIYIATSKNDQWLGDAPLHDIAKQIIECKGPSGHNVEYLLRLADFMRRYVPEAKDDHLFALDTIVRMHIKKQKMCLNTLMGNREFVIDLDEADDSQIALSDEEENIYNDETLHNPFQYISRVPA
ncbi:putative glutathione-specific gamma-glutamylcyclotransferase 2 [Chelonus insularis]|uniref:putative glutathione-specific gamma-glutamylcyclotransferase 2 n=1 Tax=Chelonus insularis TaxID=460826 RepID=UPI00158867B2|nr:putative glutathione-specific gamma-glutamylcyclotransferase 2 [Chelonus insularis]